ncbi:hypothetical protein D3C71_2198290 [compost metagenome]
MSYVMSPIRFVTDGPKLASMTSVVTAEYCREEIARLAAGTVTLSGPSVVNRNWRGAAKERPWSSLASTCTA